MSKRWRLLIHVAAIELHGGGELRVEGVRGPEEVVGGPHGGWGGGCSSGHGYDSHLGGATTHLGLCPSCCRDREG